MECRGRAQDALSDHEAEADGQEVEEEDGSALQLQERSMKPFRKPAKRVLDRIRVEDVSSERSGWRVRFSDDMTIHVHQGHGRSDLWYAMRPMDLRHEGRSPSPETRRAMQFVALASVMPGRITGPAEFFLDREGDVVAVSQSGHVRATKSQPRVVSAEEKAQETEFYRRASLPRVEKRFVGPDTWILHHYDYGEVGSKTELRRRGKVVSVHYFLPKMPGEAARHTSADSYLLHKRVQLKPHLDRWMMGDRYGEIVTLGRGGMVSVKLDRSGQTRRFRLADLEVM